MPLDPLKLRLHRARAGLTTRALAAMAGTYGPNITEIEQGRNNDVKLSTAERLARALGVRVQDLLTDDTSPTSAQPIAPACSTTAASDR